MRGASYFSIIVFSVFVFSLSNCIGRRKISPDILPKDISQMPVRQKIEENSLEEEARQLRLLDQQIRKIAESRYCTSAEEWRITPYGSKPCGGPNEYIAYHKDVETEIVPMIQDFTRREAHYNILAGLSSDCSLEPQPSDVVCKNGKAELVYKNITKN